jgi:hypothetical protein
MVSEKKTTKGGRHRKRQTTNKTMSNFKAQKITHTELQRKQNIADCNKEEDK